MDAEQAQEFLEALGCDNVSEGAGWVRASCPLAPWTHSSGMDSNPSFGVKVDTTSHCNCFACGFKGSPFDLVLELRDKMGEDALGMDLGLALQIAQEESAIGFTKQPEWSWKKPIPTPIPWSEKWLASFFYVDLFPEPVEYLAKRGVGEFTAHVLGLRYDTTRKSIMFPLRTKQGTLIGARGRLLEGKLKYYDYKYKDHSNARFALYNLERTDFLKPLVLVEGTFDALSVLPVYQNVVASLGVSLTREKLNILKQFPEIWVMFDYDKAGEEGFAQVHRALKGTLVRRVPNPGKGKDPGEMSTEQITHCLSLMEIEK